jgi:hypothetical protein
VALEKAQECSHLRDRSRWVRRDRTAPASECTSPRRREETGLMPAFDLGCGNLG